MTQKAFSKLVYCLNHQEHCSDLELIFLDKIAYKQRLSMEEHNKLVVLYERLKALKGKPK